MRLSGPQYKQLLEALISAFPTPDDLQSMVMFGLGENLHAIASGGDLRSTIFDLIRWAESRGHTDKLIKGALEEKPDNPKLRDFAASVGIEVPAADEAGSSTSKPSTPPDLNYENFDLLIDRGVSGYRARVLSSPVGQASNEFELPFTEAQLKGLFGLAGRITRNLRLSPPFEGTAQLDVQTFGQQLYNAVFRGNMEKALIRSMDASERDNNRLRIRIILDEQVPELADLPWEYLYSPHLRRFVGLSEKTVLVRYLQASFGDQPVAASPPLTMLAVISNPPGVAQLNAEKEYEQLKVALTKPMDDGTIRLERLEQPTIRALQDRLRQGDVHLIHFIGHGFFDEQINQGGLVLEARTGAAHKATAHQLGTVLNDHSALRLLFLNACEGARGGRDDAFTGTAQHLVSQGIPAVVAMQFEVTDGAAITLAEEFYEALADLYPVDAAVTAARKALSFEPVGANRPPEWGTPVLFMRSDDGRLFGQL